MKIKKSCSRCKALCSDRVFGKRCDLGYKIEEITYQGFVITAKPLEPCPKPLTVDKLLIFKDRGKKQ